MIDADVEYTFHCYDHCPYGNRVAFLMDHFDIKYKKVVYGYGSGAIPSDCDGEGYQGDLNPRNLTGKKQLPVLEGPGVPTAPAQRGCRNRWRYAAFSLVDTSSWCPAQQTDPTSEASLLICWTKRS